MARLAAIATASDVAATRGRLWQRLSVEIYKGVANAIEPRTAAILLDDDFGGAPHFYLSSPETPHQPILRARSLLPRSDQVPKFENNAFLTTSNWFLDTMSKNQPIFDSNPFFLLQSFLDDKSFTKLCQISKSVLAKILPTLSCRRQNHFRRKASQRDLIFGDPKFSFAPLFDFF